MSAGTRWPPPPWALLADDLTGACDSAVEFAAAGFRTAVALDDAALDEPEWELLAATSDSREVSESEAARLVRSTCRRLLRGRRLVYKKVDSTLRGWPAAESAAAAEESGSPGVLLCPAFPEQGRTVTRGRLLVDGQEPWPERSLEKLLARWPGLRWADAGARADLVELAVKIVEGDPAPLAAGSAGLAGALAEELGRRFGRQPRDPQPPAGPGGAVVVVGTLHPRTLDQVACWSARGYSVFDDLAEATDAGADRLVRLDPARCGISEGRAIRRLAASAAALVATGGDTARVVCGALGARAIELRGRLASGVPWGELVGGSAAGLTIVTKSGGFGEANVLVRIVERLRGV